MIRVLIRSSSPVVKAGLEALLRPYPGFQIVEVASDEHASLDDGLLADSPADVVLAEADGADSVAEALEAAAGGAPVVLLIPDAEAEAADAFRHGVRAVLPSQATGREIAAAIEAVAAGLGVFDPGAAAPFPPFPVANEIPGQLVEELTPREIEVLRAIAEGLGNKEIAARLGVTENTIKFHVASLMGKLGVGNRTQAVMQGIRRGLVLI